MNDPLLIKTLIKAIRSKTFSHWTLKYLLYRLKRHLYELTHPSYPWLTPQANTILAGWLRSNHVGFEWGAGRSTIWFARRCRHLTSIEHDPIWYKKVRKKLLELNLRNVNLIFAKEKERYINVIDNFRDESLDFILVDGMYRDECALRAIRKIKPGGILIWITLTGIFPQTLKVHLQELTRMVQLPQNGNLLINYLKNGTVYGQAMV
ncbi:MAG: hypothetical protein ACTSVW_04250 [Candidatus Njordarchaeales archaeon]